MNTWTITYTQPGQAPLNAQIEAAKFRIEEGFLVFVDTKGNPVFVCPMELSPVAQVVSAPEDDNA